MIKKIKLNIKKALKIIGITLLKMMDDVFGVAGVTFLAIGAFKIYIPAGYITLGVCFLAFAFFIARKGG